MPITADIEDLAPAELLLLLSLTSKTGKLSAVHRGRRVLLAIREGSVVYAAQPTIRERLGSMLINRGLITEGDLVKALDIQREHGDDKLLGTILVENGALAHDTLCEVIQSQFEVVIRELLSWSSGAMSFETTDMPDLGGVELDPSEILVGLGVEVDALLVESLATLQTKKRVVDLPKVESEPEASPSGEFDMELESVIAALDEAAVATKEEDRNSISELVREADSNSVSLTAEMTLAMLGSASEVAERALLFLVYPDHLSGAGGFGEGRAQLQLTGQQLRISRSPGSVFAQVIRDREPFRGSLDDPDAHRQLCVELGGVPDGEIMVVPLSVRGQVVAVLYADGGPGASAIGGLNVVEATVAQVADILEVESENVDQALATA
jgi:hypothetical protein